LGKSKIADINSDSRTYFIADIAANHDGSLEKAKRLIESAAKAGADAAKFQHFRAETIVSDRGFKELGRKLTHQASWDKSVFEVYQSASLPFSWTEKLAQTSLDEGIEFFTAPYDLELIRDVEPFVPVFKIGSGDITWLEAISLMASYKKPILLATGASSIEDVRNAVRVVLESGSKLVLMQCNTNYTADPNNVKFLNLNVLTSYKLEFPNVVLGLSDHTSSDISVLGAIALGARVIEKHFTDNNNQIGPDHKFSLDPRAWANMVSSARNLEDALGTGEKRIEANEEDAAIVQRRAVRYSKDLKAGHIISRGDIIPLRPAPEGSISPTEIPKLIGLELKSGIERDSQVRWEHFLS
jgi:N-acetylneuraminate synthase